MTISLKLHISEWAPLSLFEFIISAFENQEKVERKNEKPFLIRNLFVFRPEGTPFEDGKSFSLCVL